MTSFIDPMLTQELQYIPPCGASGAVGVLLRDITFQEEKHCFFLPHVHVHVFSRTPQGVRTFSNTEQLTPYGVSNLQSKGSLTQSTSLKYCICHKAFLL